MYVGVIYSKQKALIEIFYYDFFHIVLIKDESF